MDALHLELPGWLKLKSVTSLRFSASMAPRNYVNAGLAFIWIRLFVELWKMDKQLSVVSYLLLTGVGSVENCGSSNKRGQNCVLSHGFSNFPTIFIL